MNATAQKIEFPSFASKWGFHPCDYQTFSKLKALHRAYWEAVYGLGDWFRWNAKQPQNRVHRRKIKDAMGRVSGKETVGPWNEPTYCPIFGTPTHKNIWLTMPQHLKDHGIIADYQNARMPKASPDQVVPLNLSDERINELYDQLQEWSAK